MTIKETETKKPVAFIEFPFPLRENQLAYIKIPPNLTAEEAQRLYNFMKSISGIE